MNRRDLIQALGTTALVPFLTELNMRAETPAEGGAMETVYELRIYHTYEGKLDDLLARFRNHTVELFKRHGITSVAYWTPLDEPLKGKTLIYLLKHPNRQSATEHWEQFRADPEWIKVRDASEEKGKIVEKVDSTFMAMTDFSPAI
jgi:hypothetical protein